MLQEEPPRVSRAARNRRLRVFGAYGVLSLVLLLWLWSIGAQGAFRGGPSGKYFGGDLAMFVSGAEVLRQGGNPYDHVRLYKTLQALMARDHLPINHKSAVVRVGNPPLLFWALQPVTRVPYQRAAYPILIGLYLLALVGFIVALVSLRWTGKIGIASVWFLLMPETVVGSYFGNVVDVVMAALGVATWLLPRYPAAGGAILVLAWLKPPVALPLALVLVLFRAKGRGRAAMGFGAATLVGAVATVLATGPRIGMDWVAGLFQYSRDMAIQPDVVPLSGLYSMWAPHEIRLVLEAMSVALALLLTAWAWRTRLEGVDPFRSTAWLWFAWILATPYAHFFDLILLSIPIAALFGRNARDGGRLSQIGILYLMFAALFFVNPIGRVYLLPLPVLAAGILAHISGRQDVPPKRAPAVTPRLESAQESV